MLDRYFRPFVPGFHIKPQSDVLGFHFYENSPPSEGAWPDGIPSGTLTPGYPDAARALAQPAFGVPTPSPEFSIQAAPPIGFGSYSARPQDDVPGFNLRVENTVPGFNLVGRESDEQRQETNWSGGTPSESAPPQYSDAESMPTPPGVEDSTQPAPPQLPEWLYDLVTMPLPLLSTAFDPRTGQRIVPYAPLIGVVNSSLMRDPNARETEEARASADSIAPVPDQDTATEQNASPEPIWSTWQPPTDGGFHGQVGGSGPQVPWPADTMPLPTDFPPTLSVRPVADSNLTLTSAGEPPTPLPQDRLTKQKAPTTPPGAGPAVAPPVPEKPALETELERQPEQELSRLVEEYRRIATDLSDQLASGIARFGDRFYRDTILKAKDDLTRLAERFASDPGKTTLGVLNSFPQTRVEGELFASIAAVLTIGERKARHRL